MVVRAAPLRARRLVVAAARRRASHRIAAFDALVVPRGYAALPPPCSLIIQRLLRLNPARLEEAGGQLA